MSERSTNWCTTMSDMLRAEVRVHGRVCMCKGYCKRESGGAKLKGRWDWRGVD